MKLTKSRLKQIIQEVAQKEGLRDFVKGVFSEPEEKNMFERALDGLRKSHNMHVSNIHPLYTILQNANENDLESLVSRLEHPYGAGVKVAKLREGLDPETMTVIQGFIQIIDNFGIATYPAILALAAKASKEVYDAVKQKIDEKDPRGMMKNPEHRAE